jgi:hypothetical protein
VALPVAAVAAGLSALPMQQAPATLASTVAARSIAFVHGSNMTGISFSIAKGVFQMMNIAKLKVLAAVAGVLLVLFGVGSAIEIAHSAPPASVPITLAVANIANPVDANPIQAKSVNVTAEDLKLALGTDVYRWSTDLKGGDWYQLSLKVQTSATDPAQEFFPNLPQRIYPEHRGNTDISVAFTRSDGSSGGVLLDDAKDKECQVRVQPNVGSAEGGGWATNIQIPLHDVPEKPNKMVIWAPMGSEQRVMFSEPGATTLMVVCWQDPTTYKQIAYPRAMLTLRHVAPPENPAQH